MSGQDPQPEVSILDTVCVLYFAASKQLGLLINILKAANWSIHVPGEVLTEATQRGGQQGWDVSQMVRMVTPGGPIVLIPKIDGTTSMGALARLATLRDRHPPAAGKPDDNLGECAVVTRALEAVDQGHHVRVGIDDAGGQRLATSYGLTVFTIEDAVLLGVEHGLLDANAARTAYERMLPFGASLPTWEASVVKTGLAAAKKVAKTRKVAAEDGVGSS